MIFLINKFKRQFNRVFKKENFTLQEISGSLGDLGTFLPFIIGLSKLNIVSINNSLFFAGLLNFITGFMWNSPMPVQPMKSIGAVALLGDLNSQEVIVSGIVTGGVVMIAGLTKIINKLNKYISLYIVYGIQIGLGVKMATTGFKYIIDSNSIEKIVGILICAVSYFIINFNNKVPTALLVTSIGLIYSIIKYVNLKDNDIHYEFILPFELNTIQTINSTHIVNGILYGAIPQIPLTLLNSCISVKKLHDDIFPENIIPLTEIASSVGLMNILTCPFGGIPMCHGAGGLAGQYKFGARCGISEIFLGTIKMILSLSLGNIILDLLELFPYFILGVLLFYSGLELAIQGSKNGINDITLITIIVQLSLNTFWGFLSGFIMNTIVVLINSDKVKYKTKNIKNKLKEKLVFCPFNCF